LKSAVKTRAELGIFQHLSIVLSAKRLPIFDNTALSLFNMSRWFFNMWKKMDI